MPSTSPRNNNVIYAIIIMAHIATAGFRAPDELPQAIDATKSYVAYGLRALPKLNIELNVAGNITVIQQAVRSLCDLVSNPALNFLFFVHRSTQHSNFLLTNIRCDDFIVLI